MNNPGRVLLVANNFPPVRGGSAVVYANLATSAPQRIIVLAPRFGYTDGLPIIGWREHDRRAPYRVIRLRLLRTTISDATPRGLRKLLFRGWDAAIRLRLAYVVLRAVLRDNVRAICVGELLASSWIIHAFRWLPGVRMVAYVHGEEITTEDLYDRGHARARRALAGCDEIIVVSEFTLAAVRSLVGTGPQPRISLIRNGVDTRRFRPSAKSAELLALYQLEGCFVFVSVCRLLEKKGIDHTIRAFTRVLRRHPASRYLIVGTGPYQDTLAALAAAEGVADRVVFAGQVSDDDLAEHYQLGDVFVMPNRRLENGDTEGFGLVFLEANACGLPVIAGNDGGSTDAVQHGLNGLVVDGRSVDRIADAMLAMQEDPTLYARLRKGGLQVATEAGWEEKGRAFLRVCTGDGTEMLA
jgi:phosphatidylinositol alpha-1,6-mannosyltransferase